MFTLANEILRKRHRPATRLELIRGHIANSMVGQAVDLLVRAGKTKHGIVSRVDIEGGIPRLVVGGSAYDLDQVLTVTPATFN